MRVAAVVVALGAGALLTGQFAFGGTDQAGSWKVSVGEQTKAPAGTPKQTFLNQFFPGQLTVNAGDKVTFSSVGFHTASYTSGKPFPPFLVLPKGKVYEGIVDSAGEPFFFDGEQKFEYGLGLFVPAGPKTISRGKFASSGVIVAQNPKKPVTATYTPLPAGKRATLEGVAPVGSTEVVLERVSPGPRTIVGRATPGVDGAFLFRVHAPEPRRYRVRTPAAASPVVRVRVAPHVAVVRQRGAIAVRARPARAGSRVALQVYDREKFDFVTVARGRLDAASRTTIPFSVERRAHVRAVVRGSNGWSDGLSRPLLVRPVG